MTAVTYNILSRLAFVALVALVSCAPTFATGTAHDAHADASRHTGADRRVMAMLMALPALYPPPDDVNWAGKDASLVWGRPPHYLADPYVRAAVALQSLGQSRGCRLLVRLAATEGGPAQGHGDGLQPIVLCRMLFVARPGGRFRRPMIGAPYFVGDALPRVSDTSVLDWPLEPITLVGGVPFLVSNGYELGGFAETSTGYVWYCMHECAWNGTRYRLLTSEQEQAALAELLASPVWRESLSAEDRGFLTGQLAGNVPPQMGTPAAP